MKSIFKILTFLFLTQSIPLKGDDGIALIDVDITKLETLDHYQKLSMKAPYLEILKPN